MYKTFYLDQNATSFPKNPVYTAYETKIRTSPFSTNIRSGMDPSLLVDDILSKILLLHNIKDCNSKLIFTRGATEALNIAVAKVNRHVFCDPHIHNSTYIPLKQFNVFITGDENKIEIEFTSLVINAASSFGKSTDWKNLLRRLRKQIVIIDASQWISWNADINNILPSEFFSNGNQAIICWGLHKHLGMYPNLGVLLYLYPKDQSFPMIFDRLIFGGIGNVRLEDTTTYDYSKLPAGTFNSIDLIAYQEMLAYYIANPYFLPKVDPEHKRIFDSCFQFLKESGCNSDLEYTTRGVTASFWHPEISLGELSQRLNDYLNDLEPESEVIYRVGKFCCNYYFDQIVSKDNTTEREGRIRLSL